MLFRIWFLYVCKLGLIGFALILVGSIANAIPHAAIIRGIGLGLIVPISVFGAALGGIGRHAGHQYSTISMPFMRRAQSVLGAPTETVCRLHQMRLDFL